MTIDRFLSRVAFLLLTAVSCGGSFAQDPYTPMEPRPATAPLLWGSFAQDPYTLMEPQPRPATAPLLWGGSVQDPYTPMAPRPATATWPWASYAQDSSTPLDPLPAPASPLPYGDPEPWSAAGQKAVCSTCSPCPRVYGYGEFLFLQRSNCSDDQPLVDSLGGFGQETFFSTRDLDFDFEPAFRGLIGFRLHGGWALEAGYLGLCDATSRAFLVPPDGNTILIFPDDLGFGSNVFTDMDRIWIDYSSEIHSGELNLVCCTGCCTTCGGKGGKDPKQTACCDTWCKTFEWFVGLRYLSVAERLRIDAQRDLEQTGGGFSTESGYYDISTRNNLFGPQIGARLRHWDNRLGWEASGKVGVFYNDAQQYQEIIDYPDFELRSRIGDSGSAVAYMGELNVTGLFRLNDVWNLRAGYNVMWIGGLALAPDQLDFTADVDAGQQLDRTGGVFLHGVNLGIEARW